MNTAYIFFADGFEDIEAIAPYDILRRGGVNAVAVSLNVDCFSTSSHKLPVVAAMSVDEFLSEVYLDSDDVLVFPGGMPGSKYLAAHDGLMKAMREHYNKGNVLAAICAAPSLVLAANLPSEKLKGLKMTCYEGMQDNILSAGAEYVREACVMDGNLITARGPFLCLDFGLKILSVMTSQAVADKVASDMMRQ